MDEDLRDLTIGDFAASRNEGKMLFTAGPASLLAENIEGLRPCFGRGDDDYLELEEEVLTALRRISGHEQVVRLQGSASLALEIMALNFLQGRVLVVSTGYYSDRLETLARSAARWTGEVKEVTSVDWTALDEVNDGYDWIVACYTETSRGLKVPIEWLHVLATKCGARLMLDATGSIGLEEGHHLADVIAYSSCKGLFGLTGAAFVACNELPDQAVDSFYLNLSSHVEKRMTGPYHAITSLAHVLPQYERFRKAVVTNKRAFAERFDPWIPLPEEQQPLLCTWVERTVTSRDPRAVLYHPRSQVLGSIVCHLGEVHLAERARGGIIEVLEDSTPS